MASAEAAARAPRAACSTTPSDVLFDSFSYFVDSFSEFFLDRNQSLSIAVEVDKESSFVDCCGGLQRKQQIY